MSVPYKHLSVLMMPTDYCNMNCVYCFNSRRTNTEKKVMSIETLEKVFSITIPFYDRIRFIWHGAEPLSAGVDFYKKALELQEKYNINNTEIKNSVQTNLTLIDDEFARFLIENGIHIGSSFDGTQNEKTRHNTVNILKGRDEVLKQGGTVGFICVVQRNNIDHLIEDYEWFKSHNINYTLNPYLSAPDSEDNLYVSSGYYIEKMSELFDYWITDRSCTIDLSAFDDYIGFLLYGEKSLCCYNSCLGKHIGVHLNGDIYNCNRDFSSEFCFGNVRDYCDIHQCFESTGFISMTKEAIKRRYLCKENCDLYNFCEGGCNSSATVGGSIGQANKFSCEITIGLYRHIDEMLMYWKNSGFEKCREQLNPKVFEIISPVITQSDYIDGCQKTNKS